MTHVGHATRWTSLSVSACRDDSASIASLIRRRFASRRAAREQHILKENALLADQSFYMHQDSLHVTRHFLQKVLEIKNSHVRCGRR